jgi:hypothetical protein
MRYLKSRLRPRLGRLEMDPGQHLLLPPVVRACRRHLGSGLSLAFGRIIHASQHLDPPPRVAATCLMMH